VAGELGLVVGQQAAEVPSATASTWPGMRVATAGVPQAAASVRVMFQPSRTEAEATTQARLVEVEQLVVAHPAGEGDPLVGAEPVDEVLQLVALGAGAGDHDLEVGGGLLGHRRRPDQPVPALDRGQPAHPDDQRRGVAGGARRGRGEAGVDPRGDDVDPLRAEADLDHLLLGRGREGDHPAAPVDDRGDPALHGVADLGQVGRQHHVPHVAVDVVEHDDAGHGGPQRREERHAVPDLDQPVGAAVGLADLGQGGAGEDLVAAGLADDLVAVAAPVVGVALGPRRAHQHVEPGLGPQPGHGGGVDLGAPGLDVVEVPPGDHVHPLQAGGGSDVAQLGRWRGGVRHRVCSGPRITGRVGARH
jgi:hypothetical protein